jgi:hypothetical protein
VLGVGLRKLVKAPQVYTVVRARFLERVTGTPLVLQDLQHGWRAFGKKKPESGDVDAFRPCGRGSGTGGGRPRWTLSLTGFFPLKASIFTMIAGQYSFSTPP